MGGIVGDSAYGRLSFEATAIYSFVLVSPMEFLKLRPGSDGAHKFLFLFLCISVVTMVLPTSRRFRFRSNRR